MMIQKGYNQYMICSGKIEGFFSFASTGLVCTEVCQPIGVTVHSHLVESFENLLQRYVGEGWVAKVVINKHTIFP